MYVYVYVYVHIFMYRYVRTYMCVDIYINTYQKMYMDKNVHIYIYVYIYIQYLYRLIEPTNFDVVFLGRNLTGILHADPRSALSLWPTSQLTCPILQNAQTRRPRIALYLCSR